MIEDLEIGIIRHHPIILHMAAKFGPSRHGMSQIQTGTILCTFSALPWNTLNFISHFLNYRWNSSSGRSGGGQGFGGGSSISLGPACPPPPTINNYVGDRFDYKSLNSMRKY